MKRISTEVNNPNFGLYFDRGPLSTPARAFQDGNNFRIQDGRVGNTLLGWERFSTNWTLGEQVLAILNFLPRGLPEKLVFMTTSDAYLYDADADSVSYLTPRYVTGTASASGTTITGIGTAWNTEVENGDFISFGSNSLTTVSPTGNDSFTKILLHMNGADASTTFTDFNAGASAHVWTAAGNAQVDTAQSVFGGASLLVDGAGDWISTPDSADFILGTSDFCAEFRFRIGGSDGTTLRMAGQVDAAATAALSSFRIDRLAGNTIQAQVSNGAAFTTLTTVATYTTVVNTGWHHLAFVRNGSNVFLYIDGVQAATAAFAGTVPDSASIMAVGQTGAVVAAPFNGWIDEFRLSIGTPRYTAAFTPAIEEFYTQWFEVINVGGATTLTVSPSVGTIAAGPYTIRKIFHATKLNNWDFDVFVRDGVSGNDQLVLTNGVDWVMSYDGIATAFVEQSAMAFKCKTVLAFKNMMLYANLTNQGGAAKPMDLINSDPGSPFLAGATGVGLSEQFVVHDGQDEILALRKLGDMAVSYSDRHCVPAQFVGDPEVFVFREAAIDVGPVSRYAIADFGDYHEFLGTDSAYSFDGVTLKAINLQCTREMIRRIDPTRKRMAWLHFNEERGEVYWAVPRASDPGSGDTNSDLASTWVEHYLEDVPNEVNTPFSQRDFPFSCTGYYRNTTTLSWDTIGLTWDQATIAWNDQQNSANFPINLAGDSDGIIWVLNTSQTGNGASLTSFVRTGRVPTQAYGRGRGLIRRIYAYLSAGMSDLTITLLGADFADGSSSSLGQFTMLGTQPEDGQFVSAFRRTRYRELQFGSPGTPWQIIGYDTDGNDGGMR